jgi:hypothetical protein
MESMTSAIRGHPLLAPVEAIMGNFKESDAGRSGNSTNRHTAKKKAKGKGRPLSTELGSKYEHHHRYREFG